MRYKILTLISTLILCLSILTSCLPGDTLPEGVAITGPQGIQGVPGQDGVDGIDGANGLNFIEDGVTVTDITGLLYGDGSNVSNATSIDLPTGRTATCVVAASDAPARVKAQADYVCDGTADDVEIQAAIDALTASRTVKEKVKCIGSFTTAATIEIPSYTILDLVDAELTLANTSNTTMVTNSDAVGGNTNIEIFGGIIDGNKNNQGAGSYYGILLKKVSNFSVRDITIFDTKADGVIVWNSSIGTIDNINLNATGNHAVFVGYTSYGINISNITSESPGTEHICIEWTTGAASEATWNYDINVTNVNGWNANNQGIYIQHAKKVNITNANVYNTINAGIYVADAKKISLNNVTSDTTTAVDRYTFEIKYTANDILIENCRAVSSYAVGFLLDGTKITLSNSSTYDCYTPFLLTQATSNDITIVNNKFSQYKGQVYLRGTDILIKDNTWSDQKALPTRIMYGFATSAGVRVIGNDIEESVSSAIVSYEEGALAGITFKDNKGYIARGETRTYYQFVADDASLTLETARAGFGKVIFGDSAEYSDFYFTAAGTVTLVNNTTNVVNTDTDTKYCIIDAGTGVAIKNRSGGTVAMTCQVTYR